MDMRFRPAHQSLFTTVPGRAPTDMRTSCEADAEWRSMLQLDLGLDEGHQSVWRGGITKTGNARVRRVLAESAWCYRYPAAVGKKKYFATRHLPEDVRDVAWKAQARLTRRYRALTARGKRSTVAVTAVARELVGFMWAIALMEPAEA